LKLTVDTDLQTLVVEDTQRPIPLYSAAAFSLLSDLWVRTGWALRYSYSFSWLGRPIIQLPEDLVRVQEVVWHVQPDVIVETGVAHGGSLVFYATLLKALGRGKVVGVDVEIRPRNREAIESHALAPLIALVEGDSTAAETVAAVRSHIIPGARVLVVLDSNHSKRHVLNELDAYSPLVSVGSYIVVTDGIMRALTDVPGGQPSWGEDNPCAAIGDFLAKSPSFQSSVPERLFDEGSLSATPTYWPDAYLKRVR
jgi:cephalosporin hydroxylase